MSSHRLILSFALALGTAAASTYAEDAPPADAAPKITYEDHIKPIFRQHCFTCHNQGEAKGGLALDTNGGVITGGASGEIVYAGDHESSRLWQLVAHEETPVMPPNQDKIPQEQIDLIAAWIKGGMLENMGSKAAKAKTNNLAFASVGAGKPEGPAAMPESVPQAVPVVTPRASAITAIGASPWAPLVAVAGQKQISLYHSDTALLLGVLPFPEGIPLSLRFSRDGAFLVAAGGEHASKGIAAIYDVKTGNRVATLGDELDVAFDADVNDKMTQLAMGGPQKMLRIYDMATGELQFDIKKHTDWIYAVAFSPDGVLVASGDRSAGLCVWEASTGRPFLDLVDHKGAINSIAWRDDSNVFASASDDGTVKLWDVVEGKAIKSINAHGGGVMGVRFDHQGRLVTCGKDNRVKLWSPTGDLIRELPPMSETVLEVAITHDGSRIIAGDWTGQVLVSQSEAPENKTPIAANPPSVKARLDETNAKLAALVPEFDKTLAEVNAAQAALAAETKKREQLQAEKQQKLAMAEAAKQAAAAATAQAEQVKAELPALAAQSRDKHDLVIAARLVPLDADAAQEELAKKEAELADVLVAVATKRRAQITARAAATAKQQEATALTAAAEAMNPAIAAAEAAEVAAKPAVDAANAKHAPLAAQRAELERLVKQLAEAV
ncbi:MAG: c-type cytochrome domain-containing protein [Planctomycetaceae bacterium]